MEVRGERNGWRSMRTRQRIYRAGGGHLDVPSEATLRFTGVGAYFGGSYWKVHQLARFELRRVEPRRKARPRRPHQPQAQLLPARPRADAARPPLTRDRHYPGCNQNPYQDRVTLGTSVGWSDIYPADYDKQWIDVAGLRGCFAFIDDRRPTAPALRVERERQHLSAPGPPTLPR